MEQEITKTKKITVISGFILKIVALIAMTFDHLGQTIISLYPYGQSNVINNVYYSFKVIGRLALPLFCFLIAEGILHTTNKKKYLFRLGIEAICISIVLCVLYYIKVNGAREIAQAGNIFLDLFLGALALTCLSSKNKWAKLGIVPILLYVGVSYFCNCYECANKAVTIWAFPSYIRLQYDWLSIALIIGFYYCNHIAKLFFKIQSEKVGIDPTIYEGTDQERFAINLFSIGILFIVILLYWAINKSFPSIAFYDAGVQTFALVSGALILFYSGKRGYNAKWFKYGCYVYYPLHLAIIVGIFLLIWGI